MPTDIEDLFIDLPVRPSQLDGGDRWEDSSEPAASEAAAADITEEYSYLFQPVDDDKDAFYELEGLEEEPESAVGPQYGHTFWEPDQSDAEDQYGVARDGWPHEDGPGAEGGDITFGEGILELPTITEADEEALRSADGPQDAPSNPYVEEFARTTGFLPSSEPTLSMLAFQAALEDEAQEDGSWDEATVSMETVRALVNVFTSAVQGLEAQNRSAAAEPATSRIDEGDLRSIRALAERAEQAARDAETAKKDAAAAEERARQAESQAASAREQAAAASEQAANERTKAEQARSQAAAASQEARDASDRAGNAAGNAKDFAESAATSAENLKIYEKVNIPDPIEELIEGEAPAAPDIYVEDAEPKARGEVLSRILSILIGVLIAVAIVTAVLLAFSLVTHQPISTLVPPLADYGL